MVAEGDVVLYVERPLVGLHLSGEHRSRRIVAIGDSEYTRCSIEYRCPVAGIHLSLRSFEGIVTCSSLCIAVGCKVVLILQSGKEVVLTQRDIHLIGDDGGLGLCQVAVGVQVACQSPAGEVILPVAHDNFNDGIALAVFVGAWLVLERVGAAKRIAPNTELTVQLSGKRRKAVLGIVAAGERRHAVVGVAAEVVLMTVENGCRLVAANGARCRCRVAHFTVGLGKANVELMIVVDVPV